MTTFTPSLKKEERKKKENEGTRPIFEGSYLQQKRLAQFTVEIWNVRC